MLVVAIAEKSQRNRFMLESFARQRYERDKLDTVVVGSALGCDQFGICNWIQLPPMRLPSDPLDKVVRYLYALDEVILKRVHQEIKAAQWLAYHRLFAYGAMLSAGMMDCGLVGFHATITVDRVISGPPYYHHLKHELTVGTYL